MFFDSYPKGYSLRYNAHVMIIFSQAVLEFAKEIADQDLENITIEDRQIYIDIAEQLEQLAFEANKLKMKVKAGCYNPSSSR